MAKINVFITDADTIIKHLDELLNGIDCTFLRVRTLILYIRDPSIQF